MNTLIYLFAALFSGGLALRSWSSDRSDPPQRAFTLLGALLSVCYLLFALYLLTGLPGLRYLLVLLSGLLPGAAGLLLQRLLGEERERPIPAREMGLIGGALSLLCVPILILHAVQDQRGRSGQQGGRRRQVQPKTHARRGFQAADVRQQGIRNDYGFDSGLCPFGGGNRPE